MKNIFLSAFLITAALLATNMPFSAPHAAEAPPATSATAPTPERAATSTTPAPPAGQATVLSGKVVSPVVRATPLPFNAIVEEVLIKPGQKVKKQQVLFTYSLPPEAERALHKEMTLGAGTENLRAQILTLQSQLADVEAERNKARQLAASGLGSSQAFKRMEADVYALNARIELLRQTIDKQNENFKKRLEELSTYFGSPIEAGAPLPKTLQLTSPMDGHVLSKATGLHAGALLELGAAPVLIGLMDPMLVQVQVYESEVGLLSVGASARVEIPSLNNAVFTGTVSEIAWTSNTMKVDAPSYFTVELSVPNPDMQLKPGFKAVVTFQSK